MGAEGGLGLKVFVATCAPLLWSRRQPYCFSALSVGFSETLAQMGRFPGGLSPGGSWVQSAFTPADSGEDAPLLLHMNWKLVQKTPVLHRKLEFGF